MKTPKEDIAVRVLALVHAEKTLQQEGVGTDVVRSRIRNRIAKLLENEPEVIELIAQFHHKTELAIENNITPTEPIESKIPGELRQELSKDQLILVETLLKLGQNGEPVSTKDLVRAIYDEEHDSKKGSPDKLRVTVLAARRKIKGWGIIHTKIGVGYSLEIEAK